MQVWAVVTRLHPSLLSLLLLVELPFLGHRALGRDEVTSIEAAQRHWGALWELLQHLDAPLGLYYLVLRPVVALSDGAFAARVPSLIGAIVAVAVLVLTTDKRFGRQAAVWAGLVLLANPVIWQFADLVRPYSLALAAAAITLHVLLASPHRTVLYGVAAALTVYLQLLFALFLVAQGVATLIQRRYRLFAALCVAGVATVPLIVVASGEQVMTSWIPFTSASSLRDEGNNLFGGTGFLTVVAAVVYAVLVAAALRRAEARPLLLLGAAPCVVLIAAGVRQHVLGARYLIYVLLTLACASGIALAHTRSRRVRLGTALVLVVLVVGSAATESRVRSRGEDLRSAARYLVAHDAPGDAVLYNPDWARPGMEYWLAHTTGPKPDDIALAPGVSPRDVGNLFRPERSTAAIEQEVSTRTRVWVVGYPGQAWRPTANTSGDVASGIEASWTTRSHVAFGQIELRLLERRPTA